MQARHHSLRYLSSPLRSNPRLFFIARIRMTSPFASHAHQFAATCIDSPTIKERSNIDREQLQQGVPASAPLLEQLS